ncbi:hypothetical protein BJF90_13805 [Pseudonocardia sp. CNS-004]|nr:hypothetical protein BJF90_13805 [Pseudonocardia sp. CNS-004]
MFKFKQKDYSGGQHGICQCGNCQTRFEERYGHALPVAEDHCDEKYQHWLAYARETINEVSNRIHVFVRARRPDCAVLLKEISDVTFREANNAVDRPEPLWAHWAGELVQEVKGSRPDKPVCVNSVMFVDIPYRFTPEQSGLMALHLQQTAAHGGNPMAYMLGTPPEFKAAAFDVVRDFFTFHRDNRRYYTDVTPAAQVALVSTQTREEFFGEASTSTHTQRERRGTHIALIRNHIPFDIVSPEFLEATGPEPLLDRFRAIVLPSGATLTPGQAATIDEYVRLGGGLVATGGGGAAPEAAELPLASLGATTILDRLSGSAVRAAYLRPDAETDAVLETAKLVALDRAFTVVRPKESATVGLTLVPAARYGPPEKCHWDAESDHPGLLWFDHGEGRTAYLPWPVGELFHDLRMPEHSALLAHAVDGVGRGRQVTTSAPEQVEMVVSGQPGAGRTLVHLINYSGHNGRTFGSPLDIHDITITLHGLTGVQRATALRAGRTLAVDVSGDDTAGAVSVTLPVLAGYELIALES